MIDSPWGVDVVASIFTAKCVYFISMMSQCRELNEKYEVIDYNIGF